LFYNPLIPDIYVFGSDAPLILEFLPP